MSTPVSPAPLTQAARQKKRVEDLVVAIVEHNEQRVNALVAQGVVLPPKVGGLKKQIFVLSHFHPTITAQVTDPVLDMATLAHLAKHTPSVLKDVVRWTLDFHNPAMLTKIYEWAWVNGKDCPPAVSIIPIIGQRFPSLATRWLTALSTSAHRPAALATVLANQAIDLWPMVEPHITPNDWMALLASPSARSVFSNARSYECAKTLATGQSAWKAVGHMLAKRNKAFESFYPKAFGRAVSMEEFCAAHASVLPPLFKSMLLSSVKRLRPLGLPLHTVLQCAHHHDIERILGADAPKAAPRSVEQALVWNGGDWAVLPPGARKALLSTPFDGYTLATSLPKRGLKKTLQSNPSWQDWRDEAGNTLGHYLLAATPTQTKGLLDALCAVPQWFDAPNAAGTALIHLIEDETQRAKVSQTLLDQALGGVASAPTRRAKM